METVDASVISLTLLIATNLFFAGVYGVTAMVWFIKRDQRNLFDFLINHENGIMNTKTSLYLCANALIVFISLVLITFSLLQS